MQQTTKNLTEMLKKIEEFYQPENPIEKNGIGHEIEHIKGVIRRSDEIADILIKELNQDIRKDMVTTIACLHDIGNSINRDFHNHIGFGIIKGELTLEDVFNGSFKMLQHKEYKNLKETIEEVKDYIKDANNDFSDIKEKNEQFNDVFKSILTPVNVFNIGYNEILPPEFPNFLHSKYKLPEDWIKEYCEDENITFMSKKMNFYEDVNTANSSKLKELTKNIQNIYPKDSLENDVICKAIQDHNIDFDYNKQRYEARNIYGMIIADADKDNVPETFALRTYLYAVNKWFKIDHNPYFLDASKNLPNEGRCLTHILHQSAERFRPKYTKTLFSTQKPFHNDLFLYKTFNKIKGLKQITDKTEEKKYKNLGYTIQVVPKTNKNGEPLKEAGRKYITSMEAGDDIYSQLDQKFGTDRIIKLRSNFLKTVQSWGDPSKETSSLKELKKIKDVLDKSDSIEEAVDYFEKKHWENKLGKNIHTSFNELIKDIFQEEQNIDITIPSRKDYVFNATLTEEIKSIKEMENKKEEIMEKIFSEKNIQEHIQGDIQEDNIEIN